MTQFLAIVLLATAPQSNDSDRDLSEMLASISNLTAERWALSFDAETNTVSLRSKQRIAATVSSYSYPPGERMYDVLFRFQVVPSVNEKTLPLLAGELQRDLARCKDMARAIPQEEVKGYVTYYPQTASQWQAVLQVRRAELRVREIPQYAFKNIYLVPTYGMTFTPHPGDRLGEATARDIKGVFAIFRPLTTAPTPVTLGKP